MKRGYVFIGKGGVGKTTCSAALALKLAERGRTLVASLDPAHNLGDVYGVELSGEPVKIVDNLYAVEIDVDALTKEYLERTVRGIKEMYSYLKVLNLDKYIDTLKYSPGIEEYSILEGMIDLISKDYLVLDMPPTGLTIRVLTLPFTALIWIEKLIELRRDILDRRRTVENILGKRCVVIGGKEVKIPVEEREDPVMSILKDKMEKMKLVRDFLIDRCSLIPVLNPEPLSQLEGSGAVEALKNFGLSISKVVVNKVSGNVEMDGIKIPIFEEPPQGIESLVKISDILEEVLNDG